MKQTKKRYAVAVLLAVSVLVLTGCGKKAAESSGTEIAEVSYDVPQAQAVPNDGEEQDEAQEEGNEVDQDAEINMNFPNILGYCRWF